MSRTVEPKPTAADPVLVDDERLDLEVNDQPRRVRDCTEKLADADYDVARAKSALELTKADVLLKVKADPSAFGIAEGGRAPAVDILEAAVVATKEYQEALDKLHTKERDRDYVKAEQLALRDRKGMLECRVQLLMMNYTSTPRTDGTPVGKFNTSARKREVRGSLD